MRTCKKYEKIIKKFISNELTEVEIDLLDDHLRQCKSCLELAEMHSTLNDLPKSKEMKMPDEFYFRQIRQNILREVLISKKKIFLFDTIFKKPVVKLSPAVAFTFILLFIILGYGWIKKYYSSDINPLLLGIRQVALQNQSLSDVEKSPYLFTDVRIKKVAQGQIELTFNVTTEAHYVGNPQDPLVKEVLSQALINQTNDGYRLAAVALSGKIADPKIKEALIYSMLYDENPAVRMRALKVLSQMKLDAQLQEAFIHVLNNEKKVNMRLIAIDILAKANSHVKDIDSILKEKIEQDVNPSVQLKAAYYLEKIERREQ